MLDTNCLNDSSFGKLGIVARQVVPTVETQPRRGTSLIRYCYLICGFFFVGLAGLGVALPILPTTPFLILASACFYRSSPRWRMWLLQLPVWGPILQHWETHRAIHARTKSLAVLVVATVVTITALVGQFSRPMLIVLLTLAAIGLFVIWRIPVIQPDDPAARR